MSDSDDDYMSASFSNVTEDVRPGLVKSKSLKRKHEIEKKAVRSNKMHKTKPLREIEEENRKAGLDTALDSSNKGFAMLQKMGFKPGMKLGPQKSQTAGRGLSEPIKVEVKKNRGGLGHEEEIKKRIKERETRKKQIKVWKEEETAKLTEEFRQRMREKTVWRYLQGDLSKMRKACERLDSDEGVEEPLRPWFWFSKSKNDDDVDNEEEEAEEDDDEVLDPEDQLYFINDYLRSKYFYCVYCGIKYDNEEDMTSNCPGTEKDDHE